MWVSYLEESFREEDLGDRHTPRFEEVRKARKGLDPPYAYETLHGSESEKDQRGAPRS
jgi:hypothetical protein